MANSGGEWQSPLQPCGPPEYLIAQYRSGEYEYVGVPLDQQHRAYHELNDEVDNLGPSTAEIIASQSQDYVDEKLAEYQATIHQLQGKSFKTGSDFVQEFWKSYAIPFFFFSCHNFTSLSL